MTLVPMKPDSSNLPRECGPTPGRRASVEIDRRGPLVTVVLPTYNRRCCLAQALAGVLRQTYGNLEIFVVRDGGEEVCDIVQSFHDPRVVLIDRNENRGKAFSLNEALARARGKYVAYLDDDHVYHPRHVRTLVDAMEGPTDCQAAYGDLYTTRCDVASGGDRWVLSKHVEISRDFDRFLMLYGDHVPHVCLMHRRDLLDKTGPYNEQLNVLSDWDLARRLSFFTDFHHVPVITGEFHCPVGESDRTSCRRRKDSQEYLRDILAIRTTRPSKPWPKMEDLSIILLADGLDEHAADVMLRLWRHTFHPYKLLIPLPPGDIRRLDIDMPNVELIVMNSLSSAAERVDVALQRCEGEYVVIVPADIAIGEMWVERPLFALMHSTAREGFLLEGATAQSWGAVLRRTDLERARGAHVGLPVEASLVAAGVRVRRPREEELPFRFDDLLHQAGLAEADGDWALAGRLFEYMGEHFGNRLWIKEMAARAYFEAGDHPRAGRLSGQVNAERPTVDTLLLEAKVLRSKRDYNTAIRLLMQAEQILGSYEYAPAHPQRNCCSTQ